MVKVKNFFKKVGVWFKNHAPTKRRLIQIYAALLTNANIKGVVTGSIYTGVNNSGGTKALCTPGLNCYSCPGAVASCPIGALQDSLAASDKRAPFYILGILALFGLLFARTICGFFCPVGLGQDLLYKIKTPKVKKSKATRLLSYFKYVILIVLVISLPLIYNGVPAFCKFICPAGTFGGSIPLLANVENSQLYQSLGFLFTWKFVLLVLIIILCIFFYRFFCRFICPLGAIYGFFNKIALLGVTLDDKKCVDCGMCLATCKMDIKHVGDHECINCGECIPVCPTKAISWKGSKIYLKAIVGQSEDVEIKPLTALAAAGTTHTEQTVTVQEEKVTAPVKSENAQVLNDADGEKAEMQVYAQKLKKRSFWVQFTAWAVAIAVLIGALVYYNFIYTPSTGIPDTPVTIYGVGDTCPDYEFNTVYENAGAYDENGERIESFKLSDFRGQVVVLNYWFTSCDPCKAELPDFAEISAKPEYSDVVFIVIHSCTTSATKAEIEGVMREELKASDWNIIFTHDTKEQYTYEKLGGKNNAYPMTVILDKEGVITFNWLNAIEKGTLENEIVKAMEK